MSSTQLFPLLFCMSFLLDFVHYSILQHGDLEFASTVGKEISVHVTGGKASCLRHCFEGWHLYNSGAQIDLILVIEQKVFRLRLIFRHSRNESWSGIRSREAWESSFLLLRDEVPYSMYLPTCALSPSCKSIITTRLRSLAPNIPLHRFKICTPSPSFKFWFDMFLPG